MTSPSDVTPADAAPTGSSPFPYPFDKLEPRFVVGVAGRQGLYEVLGEANDGHWILRNLNGEDVLISQVSAEDVRGFDLPIHHCFAARNRALIVALVSGEDYDVTLENGPGLSAPLFQAVHAADLISFAELSLAAGFTLIELTNGYDAWEGELSQLIASCTNFASDIRP